MLRKLLSLGLIVALVGLPLPPTRADDTDIFGQNVQPNVLIAIDNSGSMGDSIYSAPYDSTQTYSGSSKCSPACVATTVYKKTTSHGVTTYSVYATSISAVNSSSAQTALSTTGYWAGSIGGTSYNLYVGNYLNWLASPGAQLVVKMDVAKQVLTNVVSSVQGVRFGLMTFANNSMQGYGGGQILAPVGSSTSAMTTAISNLTPTGWTPLGEMLQNAGNYYAGLGDYYGHYRTSPVQYNCQPNFVILMSDGLQNAHLDIRTVATTLHTSAQKIVVDTVGFAVSPGEEAANDIMQTAATNGGGTFYSTNNQATLEAALLSDIAQVLVATFTFATPVIPTTQTSGVNRAYMAAFESDLSLPFWKGYLEAYNRDSLGNVSVDSNGVPCGNPTITGLGPGCTASVLAWEAGGVLKSLGSSARNIYTYLGGSNGSL
ncbi:MAG TPA: vWA domain-containing protein, partial [Candidatus Methylomirabilis sp.]|nr:vWA domain-containing protein [Candidatus Methylomirabilis sp.]